uniref:Uncharacterized protein n=1 Tax=Xenopus tropicalis TaxID=8364 RepID=A0A6I8QQP0_XENTR
FTNAYKVLANCICGQQMPRNVKLFSLVRISELEMASYHYFLGRCLNLEYAARKCMYTKPYPFCTSYSTI